MQKKHEASKKLQSCILVNSCKQATRPDSAKSAISQVTPFQATARQLHPNHMA